MYRILISLGNAYDFIIILYSSCTFNYIRLIHLRLLYFLHHFIFITNISVKLHQRYEFISCSILYNFMSAGIMYTHTDAYCGLFCRWRFFVCACARIRFSLDGVTGWISNNQLLVKEYASIRWVFCDRSGLINFNY